MSPKEEEIRKLANATPFVPFTVVTASGERCKVPTHDHIFFSPNTDEDGNPIPEEERSPNFVVWGRGAAKRILFFDLVTGIDTIETAPKQ